MASVGPISRPIIPDFEGKDDFEVVCSHLHWSQQELVELAGKRVGVIGTGATGIQVIAAIAPEVAELIVFQRRPNWSSPLNNSEISDEEMADIRSRYDEIFAACAASNGGFVHTPIWGFWDKTPEERRAIWDDLYTQPGFAILAANFGEIFLDEDANREMSEYIADRMGQRGVDDLAMPRS
ncbi:MAG: hypothetical protein R2697_00925 [Ilumatobacteraceae bacterium]